ncbi:MAG: hypothetical protein A2234_09535 [Elusimicrobia bacterium RIFOXYA2_FULL_58_8]|nr:MAG: hypothetical protein A2285_06820 [Elusimicrobia bacterium RIFOXYA12_FULL_57_11]OGS14036.1 MAG: hypothetical protein A2234_09535 [Elusimicrobia bacterium RIFOXYA2_FULL_58_8]
MCAAVPVFAQDCSKKTDACSAAPARRSLFLEASAAPGTAPVLVSPGQAGKKSPEVPVAAGVSTAAAVQASPSAPAAASNPLWAIFAAAGLAGLYLYLRKDSAKRRKK